MSTSQRRVSLITDLELLAEELEPSQPMWMVRPHLTRKYATQRMTTVAEVVDLTTLDLAEMQTFETV